MLDLSLSTTGLPCRRTGPSANGAFAALALAATRRVDIVSLGDSNIRSGGSGWDDGIAYAMAQRFPQYATHLGIVGSDNDGYLEADGLFPSGVFEATTGIPAELTPYTLPSTGNMGPYQYYTGVNVSTAGNGLVLDASHPIGVSGMLRAHYGFGTFVRAAEASSHPGGATTARSVGLSREQVFQRRPGLSVRPARHSIFRQIRCATSQFAPSGRGLHPAPIRWSRTFCCCGSESNDRIVPPAGAITRSMALAASRSMT
ncbi:hypothetical protein [Neorhizobium sp. SOG26]|uniref:hypothetical protein n=1 Tax=Neorhizobium sp. SOG26 TaxID=2060726 RepID=UPI0012376177|nr:hypothetical protein [Neorhizobium sp. SOG26]